MPWSIMERIRRFYWNGNNGTSPVRNHPALSKCGCNRECPDGSSGTVWNDCALQCGKGTGNWKPVRLSWKVWCSDYRCRDRVHPGTWKRRFTVRRIFCKAGSYCRRNLYGGGSCLWWQCLLTGCDTVTVPRIFRCIYRNGHGYPYGGRSHAGADVSPSGESS